MVAYFFPITKRMNRFAGFVHARDDQKTLNPMAQWAIDDKAKKYYDGKVTWQATVDDVTNYFTGDCVNRYGKDFAASSEGILLIQKYVKQVLAAIQYDIAKWKNPSIPLGPVPLQPPSSGAKTAMLITGVAGVALIYWFFIR